VIVRELGFANICMGLLGAISYFISSWRIPAGLVGGLFLGIAGAQHVIKGPASQNEVIPTVTNIPVFLIMVAYLVNSVA